MSRADERPRAAILAAAVEVFSRRGFRAASMNDVAAKVGLRKPTLYHYVRTKQDLLVAVYEEVLDESLTSARDDRRRGAVDARGRAGAHRRARRLHLRAPDLLTICFEEESELPDELAAPILARRRAFEDLVLEAVRGPPARAPGGRCR